MTVINPAPEYWREKYKNLPVDFSRASGKDVNLNWMKAKGLRFGGEDGGGYFWVDRQGKIYHFDDSPNGQNKTNNSSQPEVPPQSNNNYIPAIPNGENSIFPIDYSNIYKGNKTLPPTNILESKAPVTDSKNDVLASASIVKDKTQALERADTAKVKTPLGKPEKKECSRNSHLYILDKDGNPPDRDAKKFFNFMNDCAGGIFLLCESGKVLLQQGKSPDMVPISETTSRILAKTIENGIQGGRGYNGAATTHTVKIKAKFPEDSVEDLKWNNAIFFDSYSKKNVDVRDFENILQRYPMPPDKRKIIKRNTVLQAMKIGHVICEYYGTFVDFHDNHSSGIKRECEILLEMLGITEVSNTTRIGLDSNSKVELPGENKYKTLSYYYPIVKDKKLVQTDILVPVVFIGTNSKNPKDYQILKGIVLAANIYIVNY